MQIDCGKVVYFFFPPAMGTECDFSFLNKFYKQVGEVYNNK